jgi:hypothetical protein
MCPLIVIALTSRKKTLRSNLMANPGQNVAMGKFVIGPSGKIVVKISLLFVKKFHTLNEDLSVQSWVHSKATYAQCSP